MHKGKNIGAFSTLLQTKFTKLHRLPVEQRVIFKVLLTYKALNNLAPVYISNLLVRYEPSRNLRTTNKYLLRITQTHLKTYGDRAFSVAAPRLWNVLPMDIKLSPSVSVFRNASFQSYLLIFCVLSFYAF